MYKLILLALLVVAVVVSMTYAADDLETAEQRGFGGHRGGHYGGGHYGGGHRGGHYGGGHYGGHRGGGHFGHRG